MPNKNNRFRTQQLLTCVFLILSFITSIKSEIHFTPYTIEDQFRGAAGLYVCDLDQDGDIDVIGAADAAGITWWRNDGGGPLNWTRQTIDDRFTGALTVYAADLDRDQDIDVVSGSWDNHQVVWWRNDGGDPIAWTRQLIAINFQNAHEVYASDLDDDGDTDVLGAAAGSNRITWWCNNGGNPIRWTAQTISNQFNGARSVSVADFDGDGDKDVVGAALTNNKITWWRNDGGNPIQWAEQVISNAFGGAHRVFVYDFESDGDPDVLAAAFSLNEISWWLNNGGDPVQWKKLIVDTEFPNALMGHPSDLDQDGDVDVVGTTQPNNDIAWWENEGGEPIVWTKHILDANFSGAWPVFTADLDRDGDHDIIVGGYSNGKIVWWENGLYHYGFQAEPKTGHAPLTVNFTSQFTDNLGLKFWHWDFDDDGRIDSQEKNPVFTYEQPGDYNVHLTVGNEHDTTHLVRENFVCAFDGESALQFDGQQSHIHYPATPTMNLTDSLTIEAWIKPAGWGPLVDGGFGRILDKFQFSLYVVGKIIDLRYNSNCLVFESVHAKKIYTFATPANSIELDKWQHIAVTYRAPDQLVIYINAKQQKLTKRRSPTVGIDDNADYRLIIGNAVDLQTGFDGVIDEVRIWNRERTENEITQNFHQYLMGIEPGLIGYWQMNEGSGDTLLNRIANDWKMSIVNASWVQGAPIGKASAIQPNSDALNSLPDFILHPNYPNPFNAQTTIQYNLNQSTVVHLTIFDVNGKRVTTLVKQRLNPGAYSTIWQGTNNEGQPVSSGVYFLKMTTAKECQARKLLLVK